MFFSHLSVPYTYPIAVELATFKSRPNRFIVEVEYKSKSLTCHLPNPGRMKELLNQDSIVLITLNNNPKRKTKASVVGVFKNKEVVQLQSNLVAKWLPEDFAQNLVPGLADWSIIKQEYPLGSHRFDFLLKNIEGEQVITEIKSTTRVEDGVACFPDGVSSRASKHMTKLMELANEGHKTMIIFVVQRNSNSFWPCEEVDPIFSKIFREALEVDNLNIKVVLAISKLISDKGNKFIYTEFISELPIINPNI
ncbi:MAG: DNA/RNA nuclease SfsA [Candidatus Heimdallarchaeota archaeon]|nr:DNA/RNA nuclease SfsA [Candidatus Heimdallarchaeota archaeon]